MLIVIIFSSIVLFVGVSMVDMAAVLPVHDEYRIEGTDYFVRYSSYLPYGLYRWGDLLCEGSFGYDWGAEYTGDAFYCNEYDTTDFGLMTCSVVKIDMTTFNKETLIRDAMIRGKCKSGELIIFDGYVSPSWNPDVNPLRSVMRVGNGVIPQESYGANVEWFDIESEKVVYSVFDPNALEDGGDEGYLSLTLEEAKAK